MANPLLYDNVAGVFLFVFQGEDVFVTDRKDSSTEVHPTADKHIPGAIFWCLSRRHWCRAVTMAIWDPYFWEVENGLVRK